MRFILFIAIMFCFSCKKKATDPTPSATTTPVATQYNLNMVTGENTSGYYLDTLIVIMNGNDTIFNFKNHAIYGGTSFFYPITKSDVITYYSNSTASLTVYAMEPDTIDPTKGKLYLQLKNITKGTLNLSGLPQ